MSAVSLAVASLRKVGGATRNAIAFEILRFLRSGSIFGRLALLAFQNAANIANRRTYYALTKARTSCAERGMKGSCFSSFFGRAIQHDLFGFPILACSHYPSGIIDCIDKMNAGIKA